MCPGGKCSSLPGYFSGQELQCKKSRSSEAQRSPKSFCKGPQAKSIRWLSCSWFSCAGRRAHRMFWIRDLNCCHVSAQTVLKSRDERTKSESPNRKNSHLAVAKYWKNSTSCAPHTAFITLENKTSNSKPVSLCASVSKAYDFLLCMQKTPKWHFLSAEEPDPRPSNIWISKIWHRIQKKVLIPLHRGKK